MSAATAARAPGRLPRSRARRGRARRGGRQDRRLCRQHPDAGGDLRDRGVRPRRSCSASAARSISRRPRSSRSAPMRVALGTVDYHLPFLALPRARRRASRCAAGAVLGVATLRLGGHYLAMVTIWFQQILTLVLINCDRLHPRPRRRQRDIRAAPLGFASSQAFLGLCLAAMALVGYLVWRLADTRLGRAMQAVRDNELAASAAGIDVFRTKVIAVRALRRARRPRRRPVRGRLRLYQPGPVRLRRFHRAADDGAARRRRLAVRLARSAPACLILIPEWLRFLKSVPGSISRSTAPRSS